MLGRIVIDEVRPRTLTGAFPAKAVVGEHVRVSADIFRDGHDLLAARVCWRPAGTKPWSEEPLATTGEDRWEGTFEPSTLGHHEFVVEAWTDTYATWHHKIATKVGAGQSVELEREEGARLLESRARKVAKEDRGILTAAAKSLRADTGTDWDRMRPALEAEVAALMAGPAKPAAVTRSKPQKLWVDRERALVGAWYELFPRSEGGLAGTRTRLTAIAGMGFDVLYLPPVHPIGRTYRKGRNNTLDPAPDDPGSPWAIGSADGGHTAIEPSLGTLTDFEALVQRAHELGMEIALDYALQCSPDHPWVTEHPEWFHHRPDGSIAYAENPPKKYQDIYPIDFWPAAEADRVALWDACRDILEFWIARGIRIFRVDNPHTKPMAFWAWLIADTQEVHPDVLFLAEAFTRPKVMAKLAEVGFSQSYTYFTWRNERWELEEYLTELSVGPTADYMRPNFWPNTPDILSGPLRGGGPAAFRLRLLLAATLVPSYGIYSGYELGENEPASESNEEYLYSEKYEVKKREWDDPRSLAPFITTVNDIRRRHPALHRLRNISFHRSENDNIMAFSKRSDDGSDVVLCVVNLDPGSTQESTLHLDLEVLGVAAGEPFEVHDELTGDAFTWQGAHPYVRLDPWVAPAHVLGVRGRVTA
ncbi:MAG TPA: alpha-1,4-glucan--maltose-1-phosphate maltosyltransferase [Acidimicrobiales bacterium]|nr:alpha-1,4-glucan--maltose-1-phosphate maltosyltransferase [Acidimicrobiales bacterium]